MEKLFSPYYLCNPASIPQSVGCKDRNPGSSAQIKDKFVIGIQVKSS